MKNKKFISIIWGYHKQIFSFEEEQNYHMMPIKVMKESGYECEIFAIDSQVRIEDDPNFIAGTKVVYYKNIVQYISYLFQNKKNIIYANSLTIKTLLVGIVGDKTVFYPHAYLFGSSSSKEKLIKFFYKFYSKIRCNNQEEKKQLDHVKEELGCVIPLAISDYYYENDYELSRREGIFIGNLTDIKNPEYILYALKILKQKQIDFKLHFIGEDRSDFQNTVKLKGLGEYVKLHGALKPSEIKILFSKSSFYINSSLSEGQCLAAYEAAFAGKILLLPEDNISFLPVFGKNSYYHDSSVDLANQLEKLILLHEDGTNNEFEVEKITSNQKMILKNYNAAAIEERLKKIFTNL